MNSAAETPGDKVLNVIQLKLQTSRDKVEREVLKGVLLSAGLTSLSNKTNRNFAIREKK
jgi:hypothetical protein